MIDKESECLREKKIEKDREKKESENMRDIK